MNDFNVLIKFTLHNYQFDQTTSPKYINSAKPPIHVFIIINSANLWFVKPPVTLMVYSGFAESQVRRIEFVCDNQRWFRRMSSGFVELNYKWYLLGVGVNWSIWFCVCSFDCQAGIGVLCVSFLVVKRNKSTYKHEKYAFSAKDLNQLFFSRSSVDVEIHRFWNPFLFCFSAVSGNTTTIYYARI